MTPTLALSIFDERAPRECKGCSSAKLAEARDGLRREAEAVGDLDDFQARIMVDRYVRNLREAPHQKEGGMGKTSISEAVEKFRNRRRNRASQPERQTESDQTAESRYITESGDFDMVEIMLDSYPDLPDEIRPRARELGEGICSCPSVAADRIQQALRESGYSDDLDEYAGESIE